MKNYIQQIIDLFGQNDYSLRTQKDVQQWLAGEEHAQEKNEALHALWNQAGEKRMPRGMTQSVRRMQNNLRIEPSVAITGRYKLHLWRAAAVIFFAISSITTFLILQNDTSPKDLIECYIPTAEISELTLPDGTRVMLNSESTLLYPEQFGGKTRSVYLIGEANFKVKSDKRHPFIVKTNDCQITALGTEFNVNAYPENEGLVTTLVEGSVKVEFNNLMSDVILKPNEQFIYNKQTKNHALLTPQMRDVTAWQRGELVFSDMCLEDIFTKLERKFPYTFVYSLHSLNENTYSFRFQKQATLKEVMEIMTQVVGDVNYTIKGNKCYIAHE